MGKKGNTPPNFHLNFSLSIIVDDPKIVRGLVNSKELWRKHMVKETKTLIKNLAWHLVKFPSEKNPIGRKPVFKKKLNAKLKWRNTKLV